MSELEWMTESYRKSSGETRRILIDEINDLATKYGKRIVKVKNEITVTDW